MTKVALDNSISWEVPCAAAIPTLASSRVVQETVIEDKEAVASDRGAHKDAQDLVEGDVNKEVEQQSAGEERAKRLSRLVQAMTVNVGSEFKQQTTLQTGQRANVKPDRFTRPSKLVNSLPIRNVDSLLDFMWL